MTVRVAICEDSYAYARGIARLLEEDPSFEVVTIAPDAETLLRALPTARPDLVTMDLELGPGLSGASAIRRIMATHPVPVVVLSAHAGRGGTRVTDALRAGAVAAISKADVRLGAAGARDAAGLRRRLLRLTLGGTDEGAEDPEEPRTGRPPSPAAGTAPDRLGTAAPSGSTPAGPRRARGDAPGDGVAVAGIVSSTGGPQALRAVLAPLPADCALPILVVQHIVAGFAQGLADWLADVVRVPVRIAREPAPLAPGVLIAPTGSHLVLRPDGRVAQDDREAPGRHRPSGDVLLGSIAAVAGSRGLGVVLTGMGRDGALGVAAMVAAGGDAWAQRPAEAAIWGMPAAAVQAGAAPHSLAEIGAGLAATGADRARG
jgi:two-component system chemotaxis response regulator CheB